MADTKTISFTNIMGQGRVNQLGGVFINGRPLPHHVRLKIIQLANDGVKPCHISRQLRVSHGAVSKILNRFAETGSISPGQIGGNPRSRLSIQVVEKQILALKSEEPNLCASELRARLIEKAICSRENAPTVSSINRHIRAKKLSGLLPIGRKKSNLSHSIENILGLSLDNRRGNKCESPDVVSSSEEDLSREEASEPESITTRCRRNRTSFTVEQLDILETAFKQNAYPDQEERERIARQTRLSEEKIMTWFSNRRARCRKNLALSPSSPYIISAINSPLSTPAHQQLPFMTIYPTFGALPMASVKCSEHSTMFLPSFQTA